MLKLILDKVAKIQMKKLQKKRVLLSAGILCILALAVGATIAYNHDRSIIGNNFVPSVYKTTTTEQFDSPDNWMTCDETAKTVFVRNDGNVNVRVRVKYDEVWRDAADTKNLPLEKDGVRLVNVVLQNLSDWELRDNGYYYYKYALAPGELTNSLFEKVVLDCNADLGEENICTSSASGMVCTKPEDDYEGAKYHLKITAETIQEDAADEWQLLRNIIAKQANDPYQIDFARKAQISDDPSIRNGNGVNKFTEHGNDIYYYRGTIDNNVAIWANQCWRLVRTTYTGGVKMVYAGVTFDVDGTKQCGLSQSGAADWTWQDYADYAPDSHDSSPADVGYMYGARIEPDIYYTYPNVFIYSFVFSNKVTRDGNTYTLDTSEGQSITGSWEDLKEEAATRYHYFCRTGESSCSNEDIGYIYMYKYWRQPDNIYYLHLDGYDDIEDLKAAMFANENNSALKTNIETWFGEFITAEQEDQLEDAVYCNDRSITKGALAGEDSDANDDSYPYNYFGGYVRNAIKNSENTVTPILECPSKNDSFTKSDTVNGNGKLAHKVGTLTSDEITMAGKPYTDESTEDYLGTHDMWTLSPAFYNYNSAWMSEIDAYKLTNLWTGTIDGARPVVSLKAGAKVSSGLGTKADPYIIEF